MLNWDLNTQHLYHQELIEQAERDHLAEEVLREQRKQHGKYNPALAWVGHRIQEVGTRLVEISGKPEVNHN
ncbi:MAG: hypothetical protein HC828_11650 [Blastochloris sp.]|nr:hypothetical protein [Blastochloris sp.]